MTTTVHICDSCDAEAWGTSKTELVKAGWRFHTVKDGRPFAMCDACEQHFATRRKHGTPTQTTEATS